MPGGPGLVAPGSQWQPWQGTVDSTKLPVTAGLIVQFDASTITQDDNTAVAAWGPALGPEGATLAQGTSGQRPTFRTGQINGLPAVVFTTAASSNMDTGAWVASYATPNTAFVVGKMTTGGVGSAGNFFTGRTGVLNYLGQENGAINIGAGAGNQLTLAHTPDANFHIFGATYSGASSAIYFDSATAGATGTTGVGTSADNMPGMRVGATSAGTANFFDGAIAEILFFDSLLDSTQIAQVVDYLSQKYAITTSAGTSATAGVATGTGAANSAAVSTAVAAGAATGTGTANSAAATVGVAAGGATGTGAANSTTSTVSASAGVAGGTGSANAPAARVDAVAGQATGTGAANNATVSTAAATNAAAGNAAGTGTANNATLVIGSPAGAAAGTGAANAPTPRVGTAGGAAAGGGAASAPIPNVGPAAGVAAGTGTANAATLKIATGAGNASGAGTANNATANATGSTNAPAGLAAGTGTANTPTVSVTAGAGAAAGTGTSVAPAPKIGVTAGNAAGTGSALSPTVSVPGATNADAGRATGAGTASSATAGVGLTAARPTGVGAAYQPAILVSAFAAAGVAAGIGAALNTLNGVPVITYPLRAGVLVDLADRDFAGTVVDTAAHVHAAPVDTAVRYHSGAPT